MLLKEWNWNAQRYDEVEYPDELVKEFVDWLRVNKQWRESSDPGRDVYTRFRRFEDRLADHRNRPPPQVVELAPPPQQGRRRRRKA